VCMCWNVDKCIRSRETNEYASSPHPASFSPIFYLCVRFHFLCKDRRGGVGGGMSCEVWCKLLRRYMAPGLARRLFYRIIDNNQYVSYHCLEEMTVHTTNRSINKTNSITRSTHRPTVLPPPCITPPPPQRRPLTFFSPLFLFLSATRAVRVSPCRWWSLRTWPASSHVGPWSSDRPCSLISSTR
jgi:hypothetical protein